MARCAAGGAGPERAAHGRPDPGARSSSSASSRRFRSSRRRTRSTASRLVFRRFLGVFARPEHPLALFLDDLQWLDAATLDLLEHLVTEPEVRHLLLVGAYRDNEVVPRIRSCGRWRRSARPERACAKSCWRPLGRTMLASSSPTPCTAGGSRAAPLAELVHEKTGGNPFFAIQFITALPKRGCSRSTRGRGWTWDLARSAPRAHRQRGRPDGGKLNRLPATRRTRCSCSPVWATVAETATLPIVHGASEGGDPRGAVGRPVRAGLIFRLDGAYTFVHDRVQEAAYALIPDDERAAMHLRIGRLLAARAARGARGEDLRDRQPAQPRRGADRCRCEEREQVAELNLIAGKRAKASTAYASALNYLAAGAALLAEDAGSGATSSPSRSSSTGPNANS